MRDKANFIVLEGFLTSLLNEPIHIERILEREGRWEDAFGKYNQIDILAKNHEGELLIFEIQNVREFYYFRRILYGLSKAITDYISIGEQYSQIRKFYSVNIVYLDFGQGTDYIYYGRTRLSGVHTRDVLHLSEKQQSSFMWKQNGDLFPEYYVLRVNEFDDVARTPIDEWIKYFKTGDIDEKAKAPGLKEAIERLKVDELNKEEKARYYRYMDNLRIQWDVLTTAYMEGKDEGLKEVIKKGMEKGSREEKIAVVKRAASSGLSLDTMVLLSGLSEEEVKKILEEV